MIHKIKGNIIHGNSLGHKLGFPTANIAIAPDLPMQNGVYIAEVNIDGQVRQAMVNIGTRPTIEGENGRFAEAHLIDFSGDLYGKEIIIFLLGYIRPEIKFASLDELKSQLEKDKKTTIDYFADGRESADDKKFNIHLNMKGHPASGHPASPHSHPGNKPDSQCPHSTNPHSIKKS